MEDALAGDGLAAAECVALNKEDRVALFREYCAGPKARDTAADDENIGVRVRAARGCGVCARGGAFKVWLCDGQR